MGVNHTERVPEERTTTQRGKEGNKREKKHALSITVQLGGLMDDFIYPYPSQIKRYTDYYNYFPAHVSLMGGI